MKRFSSVFLLIFFLVFAGCFGLGDEAPEQTGGGEQFETIAVADISIQKPLDWDLVLRANNPDELPANIPFVMSSFEPWGAGQIFATLSLATETLPEGTSTKKYATAAEQKTKEAIMNYENLENETVEIGGQEGRYLRFVGKNTATDPSFEWHSLFVAKENTGYVVSAAAPLDATADQKDMLKQMVLSLQLPETE